MIIVTYDWLAVKVVRVIDYAVDDEGNVFEQQIILELTTENRITAFNYENILSKEHAGKKYLAKLFLDFPTIRKYPHERKAVVGAEHESNNEFYGKILEIIEEKPRKKIIILDIGCGQIAIDYNSKLKLKEGDFISATSGRLDLMYLNTLKNM